MLLLAEKYNFDGDVQQIKPLIDRVSGHLYLLGEAFAHLLQKSATGFRIYYSPTRRENRLKENLLVLLLRSWLKFGQYQMGRNVLFPSLHFGK